MLDLRHILLADVPLVAVPTKRAAMAIARERGYPPDAVRQAYNRFWRFWVIGQWVTVGRELRCATRGAGQTTVISLTHWP